MTTEYEQAQPIEGDGIQTTVENPQGQAPQPTEAEKLLQAEMTRTRQALIETTVDNVSQNASKLHEITDVKLKDTVTKRLYGMSYNEATAVFGANFVPKTPDEGKAGNDDVVEEQNKKIRLLEYKQEQANIKEAIASHKITNPGMWTEGSGLDEETILGELENISASLPIDERIKRAANITLGTVFDTTSLAYSLLNKGKLNGASTQGAIKAKTEAEDKSKALAAYISSRLKRQ